MRDQIMFHLSIALMQQYHSALTQSGSATD